MAFESAAPGSPVCFPIKHIRGDDFLMIVTAQNEDETPYDFTGHSFHMQLRNHSEADEVALDIPNSSFTITQNQQGADNNVKNQVKIQHPKEDFIPLDIFEYVYDIEITDASGLVFTPQKGDFKIVPDVTRGASGGGGAV